MSHDSKQEGQLDEDLVIYDNGEYFVEIGLPVKTAILGMVYRVVNKRYNVIEEEKHHEHEAVILADSLKAAKEAIQSAQYEAARIPHNRKH